MTFEHATRPDKRTTYHAGAASMMTTRLAAIVTSVGSQPVRRYELAYRTSAATLRSLLGSVTLCAGGTCGTERLPPTEFTYQEDPPSFVRERLPPPPGTSATDEWYYGVSGDYDGDGTRDLHFSKLLSQGWSHALKLSSCSQLTPVSGLPWSSGSDPIGSTSSVLSGTDVDGDGRADAYGTINGYVTVGTASCGGVNLDKKSNVLLARASDAAGPTQDYDGDGREDMGYWDGTTRSVYRQLPRSSCPAGTEVCFDLDLANKIVAPTGHNCPRSGENCPPGDSIYYRSSDRDFNGDGQIDTLFDYTEPMPAFNAWIYFRDGTVRTINDLGGPPGSFTSDQIAGDRAGPMRRWLDVNGDGLPDIYQPGSVWVNQGGAPGGSLFKQYAVNVLIGDERSFTMDFDADGMDELMVPSVRTLWWCGGDPSLQTPGGDPVWFCGNQFDDPAGWGPSYQQYDRSVFRWDAYKLRESTDGTYEIVSVQTSLEAPVRSNHLRAADSTGDGMNDAGYVLRNQYDGGVTVGRYAGLADSDQGEYLSRNLARAPDLLTGVVNGLGASAAWGHQPLSRRDQAGCDLPAGSSFYVAHHDHARSQGYAFFTSSMWAVSWFDVSHGVVQETASAPASNRTCYRYEDAMLHLEGRGFQGFKKIVAEEQFPPASGDPAGGAPAPACGGNGCSVNNLRTTTEFNQEFPFAGRVKLVKIERAADGAPLTEATSFWHAEQNASGAKVVFRTAAVEKKFDLRPPGQAPPAEPLATSVSVDEVDTTSGEATESCSVLDDAATASRFAAWQGDPAHPLPVGVTLNARTISKETRNLTNDTALWWLGRVDSRETLTDFLSVPFAVPAGTPPTTESPAAPLTCPTVTASPNAKTRRTNYAWHGAQSTQGYRRQLSSEELVVRGVTEATIGYPTYDPFGNLTEKRVTASLVPETLAPTYAYTPDGYFRQTETNAVGHVSTVVVDPATGEVASSQAVQGGPWTSAERDGLGRVLSVTTDGTPPRHERLLLVGPGSCAECGLVTLAHQVIQAGAPTTTSYLDTLGRTLRTETGGLDGRTIVAGAATYNRRGQKIVEYAPRYADETTQYRTEYSSFDALGRSGTKTVHRDPALFAPGQGDAVQTTSYAHSGFTTAISVAKAAAQGGTLEMSRTYDARGKLIETTQRIATPTVHDILTRYLYEPSGIVTNIVDTAGNNLAAQYDDLGRKTRVDDPDRGTWTYEWDGLGRLLRQTDARGAATRFDYDRIGRTEVRYTKASASAAETVDARWEYDPTDYADGPRIGVVKRVDASDGFSREFRYDSLLRPFKVTTRIPGLGDALVVEHGYDRNLGRPKAARYPAGQLVYFDYGPYGHALGETELLADVTTRGTQYRRVSSISARGQVTDQVFGNCAVEVAQYDGSAGMAIFMSALRPSAARSPGAACPAATQLVRQVRYAHDHFLNLASQEKNFAGGQATETYAYDDLQRLLRSQRTWVGTGLPAVAETDAYAYDDLGNITSKSDYASTYSYGNAARTTRLAGPHAVASVAKTSGGTAEFTYDTNGNLVSGDGRAIAFDPLDRATQVVQGTATTQFAYAPDGARYRQTTTGPAPYGPKVVYYVDKDYELVVWGDGKVERRTYLGPETVLYQRDSGPVEVRYQHLDRLGSVDAVTSSTTDGAGAVTATEVMVDAHGFDPFGKPRAREWTASGERLHPAGDLGATTDRGFTGHEHLDNLYLIHMNGRVYDYRLGRFLSVDPIISDPANSQSINPYSYIGNNPLSGKDPTGYTPECSDNEGNCPPNPNGNATNEKKGRKEPSAWLKARMQHSLAGRAGENVTINGVDQNVVESQAKANGGQGQGAGQAKTNAPDEGNPQHTAKEGKDSKGLLERAYEALADATVGRVVRALESTAEKFQPKGLENPGEVQQRTEQVVAEGNERFGRNMAKVTEDTARAPTRRPGKPGSGGLVRFARLHSRRLRMVLSG